MRIELDEVKKNGVLVNNAGDIISTYSYKNIISDDYTIEDLKADIAGFNVTLEKQDEDELEVYSEKDLKKLQKVRQLHNWD